MFLHINFFYYNISGSTHPEIIALTGTNGLTFAMCQQKTIAPAYDITKTERDRIRVNKLVSGPSRLHLPL